MKGVKYRIAGLVLMLALNYLLDRYDERVTLLEAKPQRRPCPCQGEDFQEPDDLDGEDLGVFDQAAVSIPHGNEGE